MDVKEEIKSVLEDVAALKSKITFKLRLKDERVIEYTSTPVFPHDCESCIFLGRYRERDLYYCLSSADGHDTIVVRYGSKPEEYASGLEISEYYYNKGFCPPYDNQTASDAAYFVAYELALRKNLIGEGHRRRAIDLERRRQNTVTDLTEPWGVLDDVEFIINLRRLLTAEYVIKDHELVRRMVMRLRKEFLPEPGTNEHNASYNLCVAAAVMLTEWEAEAKEPPASPKAKLDVVA